MDPCTDVVRVAIVGDFNPEYPTHHAINASLQHAAAGLDLQVEPKWIATACAEKDADRIFRAFDGLFIASGSPYRSMFGAFAAIQFARTQGWPFVAT